MIVLALELDRLAELGELGLDDRLELGEPLLLARRCRR